ncbi:MAG: hypothetical protein ACKV2T_28515 [Kofleriaceae bacterium]
MLMALVLAVTPSALADPLPMYIRAAPAQVETPAPRGQEPVVLTLAMREADKPPLRQSEAPLERPSLMQQLRDRLYEELPVVSTAVVAPLPISSADGTLAGFGLIGRF